MVAPRISPACKISVDGQALEIGARAHLVRATVDLDVDLIAETSLLFVDPDFELLNSATFKPAVKVSVKLGYGSQPGEVFAGEVVRLEPQFRRDQPPALLVICQEPLHRLALAQNTRALNDVDTSEIVTAIAQAHGLSADAPNGSKQHFLQNNVSDAAILRELASRLGLQISLTDKKLSLSQPPSTEALTLSIGDGVKKLRVIRKAGPQHQEVEVHGWDDKQKQEIVSKAKPEGATGKTARDHGSGTHVEAGNRLMPGDTATAEAMAKAEMQKQARRSAKLVAELRGDPLYLPGQALDLDKFGYGCDGSYQIERARHEFSRNGYFVKLEAIWTGPKPLPKPVKVVKQTEPFSPKVKPKGKLVRPRWKRRSGDGGDFADMAVDSAQLDEGRGVTLILESCLTGEWREVARASATIASGTALASSPLKVSPAELFSEPKWTKAKDAKHVHGEAGEVEITAKVVDGVQVRVGLERQISGHRWEEADWDLVTVASGKVKTTFELEHPHHAEAAKDTSELLENPRWTEKPAGKGTLGTLDIAAPGLEDGRKVRFLIERLGRDGKWTQSRAIDAVVHKGAATASLPIDHTIHQPQPTNAQQLKAPTWSDKDLEHLDKTTLSVDAKGLDGHLVKFIVERLEGKKWSKVSERVVKVAGGKAQSEVSLRHPGERPASLGAVKFDPKTGKAEVAVAGLARGQVRFLLEARGRGGWNQVGSLVASIQGGKALATLPLPVLSKPRWGKKEIEHGAQVEMLVDGAGLDGALVSFKLERLEGKSWVAAGQTSATVSGGVATARLAVKHPGAAAGKSAAGDLTLKRLRFSARLAEGAGVTRARAELVDDGARQLGPAQFDPKTGEARAAAKGMDGEMIRFLLERKDPGGWVQAGLALATVAGGKAIARISDVKEKGTLSNARWSEKDLDHGDDVVVSVDATKELEDRLVEFAVERLEGGVWVASGSATGRVKGGKASAKVRVEHPASAGRKSSASDRAKRKLRFRAKVVPGVLENPRWSGKQISSGDQVEVVVDAKGLDGAGVAFVLERLDGKGWVPAGEGKAVVAGGRASAKIKVDHPGKPGDLAKNLAERRLRFRAHLLGSAAQVRVTAERVGGLAPDRLRFRAEVVPDVGSQMVRFRAEPVPDLRPMRLRFRPQLRVPADPKLTRLRAVLVGGDEDQNCQTASGKSSAS